jgi:hypothetical protein
MEEQNKELTTVNTEVTVAGAIAPESEKSTRHIKQTFERELNQIRNIISLSLNDQTLKQYASDFGYGLARIQVGESLYIETDQLYEKQKSALHEKRAATIILMEKRSTAEAAIRRFTDVARVAFRDDKVTFGALGLVGARKKAFGAWAAQSKYFYNKILSMPEAITQIGKYDVTQAELEAGKQALLDTFEAETRQRNAIAEAQNATDLKSRAFYRLERWVRKYLNVMKEALEEVPQMKEKLFIVTPSEY